MWPSNTIWLIYVSISKQECKKRPAILDINMNEPLFCTYSVLLNK